jgi:hypothetical protein
MQPGASAERSAPATRPDKRRKLCKIVHQCHVTGPDSGIRRVGTSPPEAGAAPPFSLSAGARGPAAFGLVPPYKSGPRLVRLKVDRTGFCAQDLVCDRRAGVGSPISWVSYLLEIRDPTQPLVFPPMAPTASFETAFRFPASEARREAPRCALRDSKRKTSPRPQATARVKRLLARQGPPLSRLSHLAKNVQDHSSRPGARMAA